MKYSICLFLVLVSFVIPLSARALTPVGQEFGGLVALTSPCTCTPGILRVQYTLLYPTAIPWVSRAFLLTPASLRFAYLEWLVFPPASAWHLGVVVPTPSACLVGAPPTCATLPTDGVIFYTGSSYPGFSI